MRFPLITIEDTDTAGNGATGAPPVDQTPELERLRAEVAQKDVQLVEEKRWADAARGYDAKLADIQKNRPEDFTLISDAMANRSTTRTDVTAAEELDEPTRNALDVLQTQVRQLTARNESLSKQVEGLNGARIEDNITSQIAQARTEMGSEVVDALLPQVEAEVRNDESLTRIPGGVLTLLRAADHGQVAKRLDEQRQADEEARQAKLARTTGLPARGLNVETTPGGNDKPKSALEALNLAIRTEEERLVAQR